MIKALLISVLLLVAQHAWGDPGSAHIIKAKIIFQGKEHVGYFRVWGYLYLTKDSLAYDVSKFTRQARSWVYGDTITFYSEIAYVQGRDLTILPVDKCIRMYKYDIKKIYPLALIEYNPWISSYTRLRSADKQWVLGRVQSEKQMIIQADELCQYFVLYFKEPDSVAKQLVRDLELEIRKGSAPGKNNDANIAPLIEQLRELKVLILRHCSPS